MIVALLTVLGACLLIERIRPGWKQPDRSDWGLRVLFLAGFELCVEGIRLWEPETRLLLSVKP